MSIIAKYEFDDSTAQYKRFASLAFGYIENPITANVPVAKIPLENMFRLLEMFKYDAFSDEPRTGVLALDTSDEIPARITMEDTWHTEIENALKVAVEKSSQSKEEAIEEMEEVLRQLVRTATLEHSKQVHAKKFFGNFIKALS